MKLRYVGAVPVTFITGSVGTVSPGDEFGVSDELSSAFLSRVDVEEVVETRVETPPVKRSRGNNPGQSVATGSGDPKMKSEEHGGVSNDH